MKCPYAVHTKSVTQTKIEYNEDGEQDSWTELQNNSVAFIECQKENCGAWYDDRCHYKD